MKNTWIRVYSKLVEGPILRKIGPALGLLLYLMDKSTYQQDGICIVLGGKPVTIKEISSDLEIGERSIERHAKLLTKLGFIHTINVYGNVKIWFVIGYHKLNANSQYNIRRDKLVHRAKLSVLTDINSGSIQPINPFINLVDKSVTIKNVQETKTSDSIDKSNASGNKNDLSHVKNVHSNKYKTEDKREDKTGDIKYKENPVLLSNTSSNVDPAGVLEVYRYYMATIGSGRKNPSDTDYKLVEKLLIHEKVSTLMECIDNYKEKVLATPGWVFFSPRKFFKKDFYIMSLKSNETSTYVPRNEEINPEEYGNNEVINKESENYGRKTK